MGGEGVNSKYMVKQELKDILFGIIRRKAGENAKNVHQKIIPDYILVLVNNPKQPMNAKLLKESDQKSPIIWAILII